ncbi:MAG TPA: acyl-phosphate glycerol 3-phosphate acyltransferase [Alphaproteobacteria bacterium]|jgi:glycerol-3-phosphate acyltransferase PlsY|nr:MAG: acyl-phosphate glycerol 3-phosphate acyltransferase [SAR116 cluster bacterium MED-G06]HCV89214.1 acyl-phosphate glycerol 3-phosphate acyltransferase [Alphaproteobacteria bacterium]|tara:strand:+ start:365 stop:961 length:597 start_codon:yes stop_codon:yes gene_type:complete
MSVFDLLIAASLAYLAGSVPFGLLLTGLAGKGDIRDIGSGNIGATNVLRTGSKGLALATLILDGGKGAAVALAAQTLTGDPVMTAIAGGMAVVGHCFPVWLKFKGGKGVATCLATFAAFDIRLGIVFVALWLGTAVIFRYSSLAALVATMGCSIAAVWLALPEPVVIAVIVMSGLSWARHHQNIGRLLTGKESRIGKK